MNLHVQKFASDILIDLVVITLCLTALTCFIFNSAASLVVTDIFWCDTDYTIKIDKNNIIPSSLFSSILV